MFPVCPAQVDWRPTTSIYRGRGCLEWYGPVIRAAYSSVENGCAIAPQGCPETTDRLEYDQSVIFCQSLDLVQVNRIKKWVDLRRTPPRQRKLAILLYGFPPGVGSTGTAALLNVPK